jgi:hypothetical protein
MITRRTLLQTAAAPIAGAFALTSLSKAIQAATTSYQRPKLGLN